MSCPAIRADRVSFSYGAAPVVDGVSFSIAAGEMAALAGPNGAGKSTLLALVSGCLRPGAGAAEVEGRPAGAWGAMELARVLAVVPQTDVMPPAMTALEAVLLGRSPYLQGFFKFPSAEDRRIARASLERVDAAHLAERAVGAMSGGERRLVVLARALAQQPRILLLDEPAASLDLRHQQDLFRLLRRLHAEERLTIVAVTHDLNLAAVFFDRLLLLHGARLAADGPPARLLDAELLRRVYGADVWTGSTPEGHPMVGLRA